LCGNLVVLNWHDYCVLTEETTSFTILKPSDATFERLTPVCCSPYGLL